MLFNPLSGIVVSFATFASAKPLTVNTTNGPITGHPAANKPNVVEYLGIPYAKPPMGNLRFAAPQKLVGTSAYNASTYGYDCPLTGSKPVAYPRFTPQAQRIVDVFGTSTGKPQSEDCLTLNIWAKSTHKLRPVIVFIYGGRFTVGNINNPFYNGEHFSDAEDIVVVTVNHRLNVFGFPGAPGERQNLGLRDQRAAVEWVRDNIAGFGGDPSKITLVGQSSGGVSVDYWAYSYPKDPIVHGIIAHSGNTFSFPSNTKAIQEASWNTVVTAVNCSNATDTMNCMRKADWRAIEAAAAAIRPARSSTVLRAIPPFWPTPDNDIVFPDYISLTTNGSFAKVPIVFGSTHNEDGYYRVPSFANGIVPTDEQVTHFLLSAFTCPVSYQAEARKKHGVPTWTFRYFADWDNTRLFPTSGAYHGVDLHMIFGASEDTSGLPTTPEQRKLTNLMQKAWFAFASNPTDGLTKLGWPRYDAKEKTLILLGFNNTSPAQFAYPSDYDAPCPTITMGAIAAAPS
ncbi:hypothetical protein OQA88_934 [Cercophora sp. LCS_1]